MIIGVTIITTTTNKRSLSRSCRSGSAVPFTALSRSEGGSFPKRIWKATLIISGLIRPRPAITRIRTATKETRLL